MNPPLDTEYPRLYARGFYRLAAAVIMQAVNDLVDKNQCLGAAIWLETTGLSWLQVLGFEVERSDVVAQIRRMMSNL